MKRTLSSKKTVFLKILPQIDLRSTSGRETEWIASFVGSWGESCNLLKLYISWSRKGRVIFFDKVLEINSDCRRYLEGSFNSGWARGSLEEPSWCCWEQFLTNEFSEGQFTAFVWLKPLHTHFIWTTFPLSVETIQISKWGKYFNCWFLTARKNKKQFFSD